jgi:hypothetical protein
MARFEWPKTSRRQNVIEPSRHGRTHSSWTRFLPGLDMGIVVAAILIGLNCITFPSARPGQQDEEDSGPGEGIIVRSEVLQVFLPQSLVVLAKGQSRSPALRDHGELRRYLKLEHQEDVWYALTIRGHQANGHLADITFIRRPYADSQNFPELLALLATAAGNPPHDVAADYSTASVQLMPAGSCKRDPRRVIAELGYGRSASIAQEGRR